MQKTYLGTIYSNQYGEFQSGIYPIARCLKAEQHDLSVVEVIKFEKGVDKLNAAYTMVRQDKTRQDKTSKLKLLVAWIATLKAQAEFIQSMVFHQRYVHIVAEIKKQKY